MIEWSRIKMPELIVKIDKKGWFKGCGLHHAAIVALVILLGHYVGFGEFMAAFGVGWYGCKEYGGQIYPPKVFEVMDFVAPAMVSLIYLASLN